MIHRKYFFKRKVIIHIYQGEACFQTDLENNTLNFLWVPMLLLIKAAYHFSNKSEKDAIITSMSHRCKEVASFFQTCMEIWKEKEKTWVISLEVLLLCYIQSMPSHNNLEFQKLYWLSFKQVFNGGIFLAKGKTNRTWKKYKFLVMSALHLSHMDRAKLGINAINIQIFFGTNKKKQCFILFKSPLIFIMNF